MNIERVLIVDDHPVVLDGLLSILESLRPNAIFTTADRAETALACIDEHPGFDWYFIDLNLPDINGLDLIARLREIKAQGNIIVLSSEIRAQSIHEALIFDVDGVLSKASNKETFERCIITVELGKRFLSPRHAQELKEYREGLLFERSQIEASLSERQIETLHLISQGHSNAEIAEKLAISESTVKSHVSLLLDTFQARNRTLCVAEARRLQFLKE